MNRILITIFALLFSANLNAQDYDYIKVFEPGIISTQEFTDTSPSVTSDGETMVFARTSDWRNKVPYIAYKKENSWELSRLTFADTLYNLAISPDGKTIFYKQYQTKNNKEVSKVFKVRKSSDKWGSPEEITSLYNINAGYFHPLADGTLFFFARVPKKGIYYSELQSNGKYGPPIWLSDNVSPPETTTSFDVLINPSGNKLIITRAGISQEDEGDLGPRGFFYHEKENGHWDSGRRLNLPYGWGAEILEDSLIFVHKGDIQITSLKELEIYWN